MGSTARRFRQIPDDTTHAYHQPYVEVREPGLQVGEDPYRSPHTGWPDASKPVWGIPFTKNQIHQHQQLPQQPPHETQTVATYESAESIRSGYAGHPPGSTYEGIGYAGDEGAKSGDQGSVWRNDSAELLPQQGVRKTESIVVTKRVCLGTDMLFWGAVILVCAVVFGGAGFGVGWVVRGRVGACSKP